MFDIFLDIPARKFLKKTDRNTTERIIRSIEKLSEDPIPHDSKRIMGTEYKTFRIRVGKFRILYRIDYKNLLLVIINIDSREHAYDNI